ncbi:MAG: alpha/beta hydrolase [Saprospiraceae bacterium]|nr:alpha/beta hydrolase [Saprospiraceae bacterium]
MTIQSKGYKECTNSSIFGDIHYKIVSGKSDKWISFLHGYPTSSLDYSAILSKIPDTYNVIAHDHLGFGHSDKPIENDYLLTIQADIAIGLYEFLNIKNVHIVAHDYGTSVATEVLSRYNSKSLSFQINSLTLCNGSMLIDMAKLRLIQRLLKNKWIGPLVARMSSSKTFHRNMKNIWFDRKRYNKHLLDKHWELLISKNGKQVLSKITRYIDQRYENYDKWIGALQGSNLPVHILWAANDPVAVKGMAFKLDSIIENSHLTIIEECGHYPMIEKEEEWLSKLLAFILYQDQ